MERIVIARESMSARQPLAALVKISELGRSRPKSPDSGKAAELRNLLSRPLAPLSNLDERERRSITDARLASLEAALDQIRPDWIHEYAAAAAIALPPRERRLREFMLRELFRSNGNTAHAFAGLANVLRQQPKGSRNAVLSALLRTISSLPDAPRASSFEETEHLLMALVSASDIPGSPKGFALLARDVALAAAALSPDAIEIMADDGRSPLDVLLAEFDAPYHAFLLRPRWGSFAREINAALWHQLWHRWRKPAAASPSEPTQQSLLKEAAWSEADQAIARALQDSGRLARSLERLESVAEGEAAARTGSVRGASNLVLQWLRQAARSRNLESQGAFGESTEFDPALHESHEAEPGERVRILKPTVMRSNGSQQAVVLRGEVELE